MNRRLALVLLMLAALICGVLLWFILNTRAATADLHARHIVAMTRADRLAAELRAAAKTVVTGIDGHRSRRP
jgi:hypothetical protein